MFDIVFLGTSASAPSIYRGLSAQIVMAKEHRFLIDCGEGTQRQILKSGIGFRRINKILLTHGHLDHILGLGGLLSTFTRWEAMEHIEVWGGKSTLDRVKDLLYKVVLRGNVPPVELSFHRVKPGVIYETKDFTLSAFKVQHRGPDCFGYSFEAHTRRPFLNDQAEALGVPQGPERRHLVEGQPITLESGQVIYPDDVLGEAVPGTKLCFTGDYGSADSIRGAVHSADVLVSEATYIHEEADMAFDHGHMTARGASELARSADIKNLILTHLSRRHNERAYLEEAQAVFPQTVVARDFDHYRIKSGELTRVES